MSVVIMALILCSAYAFVLRACLPMEAIKLKVPSRLYSVMAYIKLNLV